MRSSFILSKNRQKHKPSHCFVGNQIQYQLKHTQLAKTHKYHRLVKKKIFKKSNVRWEKKTQIEHPKFSKPKEYKPRNFKHKPRKSNTSTNLKTKNAIGKWTSESVETKTESAERVRFPKMPLGSWLERATPGRRSTMTRFCSQITPAQRYGLVSVMFHRRVLPPTTKWRAKSANGQKPDLVLKKGTILWEKWKPKWEAFEASFWEPRLEKTQVVSTGQRKRERERDRKWVCEFWSF